MHEKTNPNIKTIRPLKDGVIADFNATELMLRGMIKKVKTSAALRTLAAHGDSYSSGSTNVEIRAVRDSAEHAGGREVHMIYEPMAAALSARVSTWRPPKATWSSTSAAARRRSPDLAGRHRLLGVDQHRGRRLHQRHPELRPPAAQHPHRRTHGRGDQMFDRRRRFGPGQGARGLRRDGSQHADRTAPDRVALVQRNRLRAGKVAHEDRRGADEGARIHAARAVRRHREERHLPRRRRALIKGLSTGG